MQTPAECATGKAPTRRPSDRELLSRFLAARDESAFAELVTRYSRLVMSVALHTLRDPHAAEDAFQATFLVLAKSARRIRNRDSLASWLHGTTFRVSHRLLRTRLRRKEQDLPNVEPAAPWDPPARPDEQAALDEELARLSEGLRGPLVLHYLEGRTVPEIAAELKMTPACVEGRLKRGKQTLRKRLLKRGVLLSSAIFGAGLTVPAEAGVAATLLTATVAACLKTTATATLTPIAASTVQHIALQEMAAMTRIAMMKTALVCCGAAGVIGLAGAAGNGQLGLASSETVYAGENVETIAAEDDQSVEPQTFTGILPATAQLVVDSGRDKSESAEARLRVLKALDQRISLSFHEAPLSAAIQKFSEHFKIDAKIDNASLSEVGVSDQSKVSAVAENITLREALPLILGSIPGGKVAYEINHDGMLTIVAQSKPVPSVTGVKVDGGVLVTRKELAGEDKRIRELEDMVRATQVQVDNLRVELAREKRGAGQRLGPVTGAPLIVIDPVTGEPVAGGGGGFGQAPNAAERSGVPSAASGTPPAMSSAKAGTAASPGAGYRALDDMAAGGFTDSMISTPSRAARPKVIDDALRNVEREPAKILRNYLNQIEARAAQNTTEPTHRIPATAPTGDLREFHTASRQEDHIRSSLTQSVDFQFTGQTLQEVMNYLETEYSMTIRMDTAALTGAGVGPDQEINLILSGVSLGAALNLMLKDVAGTQLDYVIEDEVMTVTTREKADQTLQTVIYDLSGLGPETARQISTILEKTVEPASWEPLGGSGTIVPVDNSVIITTSRRLHDKTAKILQMLQQQAKATRP